MSSSRTSASSARHHCPFALDRRQFLRRPAVAVRRQHHDLHQSVRAGPVRDLWPDVPSCPGSGCQRHHRDALRRDRADGWIDRGPVLWHGGSGNGRTHAGLSRPAAGQVPLVCLGHSGAGELDFLSHFESKQGGCASRRAGSSLPGLAGQGQALGLAKAASRSFHIAWEPGQLDPFGRRHGTAVQMSELRVAVSESKVTGHSGHSVWAGCRWLRFNRSSRPLKF